MFEDATVYRNRVECSGWLSRTLAPCLTPEKVRMACGTFLFRIRAYNTVTAEQIPLSDVMCFYRDFEAVERARTMSPIAHDALPLSWLFPRVYEVLTIELCFRVSC